VVSDQWSVTLCVAIADHYSLATDNWDLSCSASKWQQGDVARLLDRQAEAALVRRADAGQTAWHDLAALSNELRQQANVLVVDRVDLLDTEFADFLAAEKFPSAGSALTPTGTGWTPLSAVPIGGA